MSRRTPVYEAQKALHARFVPFADWEMPVSYSGVLDEHRATRSAIGLFDVSHMGRILVEGSGAEAFFERVATASVESISPGSMQYTLACNHHGGILDDLMICRTATSRFAVCANASNAAKIYDWFKKQAGTSGVEITNQSSQTAQFAVQGPRSREMLSTLTDSDLLGLKRRQCLETTVAGIPMLLSRSGYTGELGYEMYLPSDSALELWNVLIKSGETFGLKPCGLGARDTLRLEMGYPLYGNDIDETTTPLEASLEFAVDFRKDRFIGRDPIVKQRESGLDRRLVGFELVERGVPRHGLKIYSAEKEIGEVGSGNHSPSLNKGIGMGYVLDAYAKVGQPISIDIRGRTVPAVIVERPFYRKKSKT